MYNVVLVLGYLLTPNQRLNTNSYDNLYVVSNVWPEVPDFLNGQIKKSMWHRKIDKELHKDIPENMQRITNLGQNFAYPLTKTQDILTFTLITNRKFTEHYCICTSKILPRR